MNNRLLATSLAFTLLWSAASQAQEPSALFVLDGSGSMWGRVEGRSKIEIAREVMGDLTARLPADVRAGLIVYGHNRKDDCRDIELVAPVGTERAAIIQALNGISPKGKTPLTEAIRLAATQFRQHEGSASVVVVSDGKETCEGDPCAAAREAAGTGVNLRIHVIGFDVTAEETEQLTCIADEGRGKYFAATNAEQLVMALAEVEKEVVAPPPEPTAQPEPADDVLFEDHFERDELGEMYQLLQPDAGRFALLDGKVLSVATHPPANSVVLKQPITGDFVATIAVTMQVQKENFAELNYWVKKEDRIWVSIYGTIHGRREMHFGKTVSGKTNIISSERPLGSRKLGGYSKEPEIWYFQIEKSGVKFTGRMSPDGTNWTELGTHTVLAKSGQLGFRTGIVPYGQGIENAAEFDNFVVKRAK